MDRKNFLLKLGLGTAAIACSSCLWECSNPTSVPSAPSNVDFTLDLTSSANSALTTNGGSQYQNDVLIGRVNATTFIAVSQICTHQGSTVQFQLANNRIHCPTHGSNFNLDGSVINGPAASPLRKYNTTLNGTSLRVYS